MARGCIALSLKTFAVIRTYGQTAWASNAGPGEPKPSQTVLAPAQGRRYTPRLVCETGPEMGMPGRDSFPVRPESLH
jgi:hypothetical protein